MRAQGCWNQSSSPKEAGVKSCSWETIMRSPVPLLTAAKLLLEHPCIIGLSLKVSLMILG